MLEHPGREREDERRRPPTTSSRLIFDKKADLVAVHKEAENIKLQVPEATATRRSRGIPAR